MDEWMTPGMEQRVPAEIDVTVPSTARIYDFLLGGKDNFAPDREAAQRLIDISPDAYVAIRENRAFLQRAVRAAAESGIRQFIDLGSGLPTQGTVHELVPEGRVVYVDNDTIVAAHGRALLGGHPGALFLEADAREPDTILGDPALTGFIDVEQPIAVLLVAIVHFIPDAGKPAEIVARYRDAGPPGSLLILSHGTADPFPDRGESATSVYRATSSGLSLRPAAEVERFFDGYELLDPGLVYAPAWRPTGERLPDPSSSGVLAGVGRRI